MKFVTKYKFKLGLLFVLIAAYFLLRLPNLTLQPIFADEAIYIRWAQVMKAEPTLRFLPLTDGKTPLFMWTLMPLLKFIPDPLLAGRFLSVTSGFFTLLGIFFLSRKVFSGKVALWASLLYVITPYTVFFDRMALVDSMLATFTIWALYFSIWLVQSVRLDIAMILGYFLGGAILTKTPAIVNLFLIPFSILGFRREKGKMSKIRLFLLWTVAIGIALFMYNLLRLGPEFQQLSSRNQDYIFSPLELIDRPLDPFIPHLRDISDWFPKLFTWPILFSVIIGALYILYKVNKLGLIILLWAIIPLIVESAFLKTFTARYLYPSVPPLLILGGFGINALLPKLGHLKFFSYIIMLVAILPLALNFDYLLITKPEKAPLPKEERKGYFEAWTAGYGFPQIAQFLKEERKLGRVVVGTEGFFGTLPDGLKIYLDKDDIVVLGSHATISAQIRDAAKENLTFFVGNKLNILNKMENVQPIKEYPKPMPLDGSKQDAISLYKVFP